MVDEREASPAEGGTVSGALPPPGRNVTRTTGNPQSQKAAVAAWPRSGTLRVRLLHLVAEAPRHLGVTDDEMEVSTGRLHQSVSSARNSLMNDGWLEYLRDGAGVIVKRHTRAGQEAGAWTLSSAGWHEYGQRVRCERCGLDGRARHVVACEANGRRYPGHDYLDQDPADRRSCSLCAGSETTPCKCCARKWGAQVDESHG